MNLLIVSTVDFNKHGIPVSIMNNYRLFNHNDIHCTFVTYGSIDEEFKKEILQNGDEVFLLPHRKKRTLRYIRELRKIAKSLNYDIAHVHGNSSTMLFELLALKGLVTVVCQAHNTDCVHSMLHKVLYPLFIKEVNHRVACTYEAGIFLYQNNTFKVLKNGISAGDYKFSNDVRKKIRDNMKVSDKFVILHVGSFNKQKNHEYLIDIFKMYHDKNPKSQLWLVGEGATKDKVKNLTKKYEIEEFVNFIGRTNEVAKYMMAADCFVLPSLYESFGIVNVEAQATGLPCVVSTSVPDAAKVSEYFYKVSLNDVKRWVETIELCQEIAIQRKISYLDIFRHGFDVSQTSEELINYYKSLWGTV